MKQPILGAYNDNLNVDSATTEYNMLMGGYTWSNSESQRREVIPTAGKLRKLYVHLSTDPANAGSSYTFTVMVNGSATALTVTIAAGSTSGSDLVHELTLAAGDYVSLRAVASATDPVAVTAAWATEFESSTAGESIVMGVQGTSNTTTQYGELGGRYQSTDETVVTNIMPTAGTFKNLYVLFSADPGNSPDDYTIALRVNATTTNNTVTVVANDVTGHDTAHTDDVAAGDLVDLIFIPENTPFNSPYISWGMVFVSDTDGESLIFGGSQDAPAVGSVQYYYLNALELGVWNSTEANVYSIIQAFELKKMYVHLKAAPGSGKHQVISINSPGNTATGLSVDITGTATDGHDTAHTYTPANGDVIDLKSSPSGTPTASIVRVGLVAYLATTSNKADALQDNFNDNSLDGTKWEKVEVASATVQETNGTIVITPAASTASSEGVLVSYPAWTATKDLTGSEFVINLKQALNASANAQTYFYVVKDDNNWLSFAIKGATRLLYANGAVAGTPYYDLAHATYNASTMQWLRIREFNGYVSWEYSADRLTWTQLFTVANPFAVTAVYEKVGAVANNVATPGTAIFDNFNVYPNVGLTGTLLSAGTVPSQLGFDFFASADNTDPDSGYSAKLDALYAAGIRHLRIGLAAYSDSTSLANTKTVAAAAVAKGFNVVFGITVGEYITSSNWSSYVTAAESAATWAQANGIYEFQLGNEEEWHVDGTTMTAAQLITNMKSLATSVQAIFTNGNVSYAIANSYISDWVTAGRGDIDLIACNIYMFNDVGPEIWQSLVDSLYTEWGSDHSYLSEFAPDSYSLNHYSTDETVQAAATSAYIDYLRSKGYSRYFFFMYYDDARPGGPVGFGALKTDASYRKLWNTLLAQTLSGEDTIRTGGKTIILTLTNDTWVASGATFDAQRQNIINGLDSAQSEGTGWDAEVKAKIAVTDVVRTSDVIVTITLPAEAAYNITANELITCTVPSTALVGGVALVAYPKFGVAFTTESTLKSLTDSGQGSDQVSIRVFIGIAETGHGTDAAPGVKNSFKVSETGSGSDTILSRQINSILETGSGSDAIGLVIKILLSDSATASDALSILRKIAVSDSGSGADAAGILARIAISDSAVGNEALSMAMKIAVTDTGAGAETIAILRGILVTELASGNDTIALRIFRTITDSGSGSDIARVTASFLVSDTGQGSDLASLIIRAAISDTATGSEMINILRKINVTDSGAGSDLTQLIVRLLVSDSGAGADEAWNSSSTKRITDTGLGSDSINLLARILLADNGVGSDAVAALARLAVTDSAAGNDAISVINRIAVSDSFIGSEIVSTLIEIAIQDSGVAADVISIIGNIATSGYHYGPIHCLKDALNFGAWIKRKKFPYPHCNKNP